jgi:hypothetical protein
MTNHQITRYNEDNANNQLAKYKLETMTNDHITNSKQR